MLVRRALATADLCLLVPLSGGAEPAVRPEPAPRPDPVLDRVPGLERPVTLAEAKIPLGELLQRLTAATGVQLYADRSTADEPATVVATDMPAVRLLGAVARFFDYRWVRESTPGGGTRYRLYQDLSQKGAEQALRDAAYADEQQRLRIVLDAYVKVGQLSDAQYAAQRDELDQRPPGSPRPSIEQDRIFRGLRECNSSAKRSLARLLGQLTPQDWKALWQGQRLRLYSKPEPGERGLPPDVTRSLSEYRPSASWDAQRRMTRSQENPEALAALRKSYDRQDQYWNAAEGMRVVVRLNRASEMGRLFSRDRAATSLTAFVVPLANEGGDRDALNFQPEQIRVWIWAANTQPKWGYDSPERLAELEKDPVFNVKQPFSPRNPPVEDWRGRLTYGQLPELLPEVARTFGVSFLGDAYWPTPVIAGAMFPAPPPPAAGTTAPAAPPAGPPIALGALLNRLSGRYENDINRITFNYYRWDREDKLVLLRDRTWFFDRRKEIPKPVVARWDKLFAERGCLPLEEYLHSIAALTDEQWDSIAENSYSPVFPPSFNTIPSSETDRTVLRLFRALNGVQQQRLKRGGAISWTEMTPAQRELFLSVVEDQSLLSPISITRADLAGAGLSLTNHSLDLIRRKQGNGVRETMVSRGLDPNRYPELFEDPPPAAAGANAPAANTPAVPPISYARFPAQVLTFAVRCGRANPSVTRIITADPAR